MSERDLSTSADTNQPKETVTSPNLRNNAATLPPDAAETEITDEIDRLVSESVSTNDKIAALTLKLEVERLKLDAIKSKTERRFWNRNFGTVITAIISLVAVLVSLSQVWVAKIQKDQDIQVAQTNKERELEITAQQKGKELTVLIIQQDRAWKLDMAKFISEHGETLFGSDMRKKQLIRNVILTTFPADISENFFNKLEAVSDSPEDQAELRKIQKKVIPSIRKGQEEIDKSTDTRVERAKRWEWLPSWVPDNTPKP